MAARSFIAEDGTIYPVQFVFKRESLQTPEMGTLEKLARALRTLAERLSILESASDPGYVEFEYECTSTGTTVFMEHGYIGGIRWYVSDFVGAATGPVAPRVWRTLDSTDSAAAFTFDALGKYIVRISPSGTEGV